MDRIVGIYQFGLMVIWGVIVLVLAFYQLDKSYDRIMQDLAEREAQAKV